MKQPNLTIGYNEKFEGSCEQLDAIDLAILVLHDLEKHDVSGPPAVRRAINRAKKQLQQVFGRSIRQIKKCPP